MKLVMLIASTMTAVLMTIHILEQRYKRKRIAEIAKKLEDSIENDSSRID